MMSLAYDADKGKHLKSTWRDADSQGHHTEKGEPVKLAEKLNDGWKRGHGFDDWQIITPSHWDSLVGNVDGTKAVDHLNARFGYEPGTHFTKGDLVWVDKKVSQPAIWWDFTGGFGNAHYPSHTGVELGKEGPVTSTPNWPNSNSYPRPALQWLSQDRITDEQAQQIVADRFDANKGIVIVSRTVDTNYMAYQ